MRNQPKTIRQRLERISSAFLFVLPSVFLFCFDGSGYLGIQEVKFRAFYFICGGYIVVMALAGLKHILGTKPPLFRTVFRLLSPAQYLALLYALITWVSALASEHYPYTIIGLTRYEGALTITIYCLLFILLARFGTVKQAHIFVFAACVLAFSVLCIIQLYGNNPFSLYPSGYSYFDADVRYSGSYLGTIGNADSVAAFLCLAIPVLWTTIVKWNGKTRRLLLLPLAASVFVLIKMHVLAGFVGVFGGGAVLVPFLPRCGKNRRLLAVIVCVCMVLLLLLVFLIDPGGELFHELHCIMNGDPDPSFGSGRIHIWSQVLRHIPDRFLLGTGPDTMILEDIAFSGYDEFGRFSKAPVDVAHNEYLNVLFHQGCFALLAYASLLVLVLIRCGKRAVKGDREAIILGSAVLCYCIQAFFGFSSCITSPFFWTALGLADHCTKQTEAIQHF